MEKSGKRGKIPQSDWPLIMTSYEAGETLSSIARTYDCSPPAISYIVSRSRGKAASDVAAQSAEPQLIKIATNDADANDSTPVETPIAPPAAIRREPIAEPHQQAAPNGAATNGAATNGRVTNSAPVNGVDANGSAGNGVPANGDQRRTLHLSLG